jgi:hypothetical protein
MNRAGHYMEAERLTERAVEEIARCAADNFPALREAGRTDAALYLAAALIHATLAAAGPGVEQAVIDQANRDATAAQWAADAGRMTQQEQQAARPPLPEHPKPRPPERS